MAELDLERRLSELRIDWPETPDLASSVRAAIAPGERLGPTQGVHSDRNSAQAWWRERWRPRRAVVALVVAALGATAAIEPARSAVLEFLGLKSAKIERREPDPPPAPTVRAPLGADLGLGRAVTLAEAARVAGFTPGRPEGLGAPGAVYVDAQLGVSLVYAPRRGLPESEQTGAGLLVTQVLGQVTPYIGKAAGAGTSVDRLRIDGDLAYFLSGEPHGFAYESYAGDVRFEDQRLAGNTLLVEHDDLLIRIEGEISRDRAVRIAREVTATFARDPG